MVVDDWLMTSPVPTPIVVKTIAKETSAINLLDGDEYILRV
jgi:hypothetical protein